MLNPKAHIALIWFFLTIHSSLFCQVQIGGDIDGEHADDHSGWCLSLSADGKRVAVGSIYNSDGGHYAGQIRVFDFIQGGWTQAGQDLDGTAPENHFGETVAISDDGQVIAVGAPNTSMVRLFEWKADHWEPFGNDIVGAGSDRTGHSVALAADGRKVAIGVPNGKNNNNVYSGVTRVFQIVDSIWIQVGADVPGQKSDDQFGASVALSDNGQIVAVGADYNDNNGDSAGQVRTYKFNGTNWIKLGADLMGEAKENHFGSALGLNGSGDRMIVGAFANNGNGNQAGQARIFKSTGSTWSQMGPDLDGDGEMDQFGVAVAISSDGNTVGVGQPGYFTHQNTEGLVRLFRWNGTAWTPYNQDIHGEAAGDFSGTSVSLSSDGSIVAIAGFNNDGNGDGSGHIRVYKTEGHPTSIPWIIPTELLVYPNPSNDKIYLKGLTTEFVQIEDCTGQIISSQIYSAQGIDVHFLSPGIYTYRVIDQYIINIGNFVKSSR